MIERLDSVIGMASYGNRWRIPVDVALLKAARDEIARLRRECARYRVKARELEKDLADRSAREE